MNTDARDLERLRDEVRNFEEIARTLRPSPGEVPRLPGIEMAGFSRPLFAPIGGDHLVYIDFEHRYDLDGRIATAREQGRLEVAAALERNRKRAGILVADVAGHRITDGLVAAMLHQAFLLGTYYELEMSGEITTRLFDNLRTRFYESTGIRKFVTLLYGEIDVEGRFRFISAGHPRPLVFSRAYGRLMPIAPERCVSLTPLGMFPAPLHPDRRRFTGSADRGPTPVNEIQLLGAGDVLLLFTDGLAEHDLEGRFFPSELERVLVESADASAEEITRRIEEAVVTRAPQQDDVTTVVVKRG